MTRGETVTAAEAGFVIDDRTYPVPSLDTFTMDEAFVLYDYSGLALDDFAPADPDDEDAEAIEADRARRMKHPGLIKALLHIAYQRGNPTAKDPHVRRVVGALNLLEAFEQFAGQGDGDAAPVPLDETNEPNGSSPRNSGGSNGLSGSGSPIVSAAQVVVPRPITPTRSGMSST